MSCVIKLVNAETPGPDLYLSTATPPIWDVAANAQSYATGYAALGDAFRTRDGVTAFPVCTSSDRVVIWDQATGIQYAARPLASLI